MTGWLVGIGVPVAGFLALIGSVWHHKGRNTGRHVARPDVFWPDVYDATKPIAHTKHGAPWDEAPEPDPAWVMDLRAALHEVQPSGWVKPELHHILAAPTLAGELDLAAAVDASPQTAELAREPAHYGVQFDEQGREVGWLPDPYDMWGTAADDEPEPSRLADTADRANAAILADVAVFMAAQDADATRYGEDLAGWCAGQLRALRETLCTGR